MVHSGGNKAGTGDDDDDGGGVGSGDGDGDGGCPVPGDDSVRTAAHAVVLGPRTPFKLSRLSAMVRMVGWIPHRGQCGFLVVGGFLSVKKEVAKASYMSNRSSIICPNDDDDDDDDELVVAVVL